MSLINITDLTFAHAGSYENIFENVSFRMDTEWKLGLIGRNGRGKTTLLNLLRGKYEYAGRVSASVDFDYFPYEVADKQAPTRDIVNALCRDHAEWQLLRELSLLQVEEEALGRPFATLSNGEQTKVLLAMLFLRENRFLLIDEPTNHLDLAGRALVSDYLKSKRGFILVSHDRDFLDNCVDHILALNKTGIELERGNFSSWFLNKERRDHFERAENEKLQKEIKNLRQSARQSGGWADKAESTKIGKGGEGREKSMESRAYIGEKSRRMQQRRKNLERRQQAAAEDKAQLLKDIESRESLRLFPLAYHTNRLVSLRNVAVLYDDKAICRDISFSVEQGERIALCGRNGCGKSSVLKLIRGEDIAYSGEFSRGSRLLISYVAQDAASLSGSFSGFARQNGLDESLFKALLRKLDFSRAQFDKDMGDLSAGQKKKVLLAGSLCQRAHLYIWDEPLNYIDIYSRMQIEELLLKQRPTLLFVEHDSAFCENIATQKVLIG